MVTETWTAKEVELATGIKRPTVSYRCNAIRKRNGQTGWSSITYEEIQQIINFKPASKKAKNSKVASLKAKLKNDGYKTT